MEADERGNSTVYLYGAYGSPDKDKVLRQITSPNNIHTLLSYDLLNRVKGSDPNGTRLRTARYGAAAARGVVGALLLAFS
jgi:hypothetical protein